MLFIIVLIDSFYLLIGWGKSIESDFHSFVNSLFRIEIWTHNALKY